jgi:hypothetical protein
MLRFQDRVFYKHGQQWFVWEPAWESMRPIRSMSWNGSKYSIHDEEYTDDPFSESFGFGDLKSVSDELTEKLQDKIDEAISVQLPLIGEPIWMRDRWVVCDASAVSAWRQHHSCIQIRTRTCKKCPRGQRFTKRVVLSDKR